MRMLGSASRSDEREAALEVVRPLAEQAEDVVRAGGGLVVAVPLGQAQRLAAEARARSGSPRRQATRPRSACTRAGGAPSASASCRWRSAGSHSPRRSCTVASLCSIRPSRAGVGVGGGGVVGGEGRRVVAAQRVHVADRLVQLGRIGMPERERRAVVVERLGAGGQRAGAVAGRRRAPPRPRPRARPARDGGRRSGPGRRGGARARRRRGRSGAGGGRARPARRPPRAPARGRSRTRRRARRSGRARTAPRAPRPPRRRSGRWSARTVSTSNVRPITAAADSTWRGGLGDGVEPALDRLADARGRRVGRAPGREQLGQEERQPLALGVQRVGVARAEPLRARQLGHVRAGQPRER